MARRKLSGLILSSVLVLSMIAGCTNNSGTNNEDVAKNDSQNVKEDSGNEPTVTDSTDVSKMSELKITVLGASQTGNKQATEDVLTPIWREKTKVIPTTISVPTGGDYLQWFQTHIVAGDMPEVLATNGVMDNPEIYRMLIDQDQLREITKEELEKYMPRTKAYLEKLGVSIEQLYNDNLDSKTKKLWYVPAKDYSVQAFPPLRSTRLGIVGDPTMPYANYVRDDILKQIFPNVKTEKELQDLYIQQGGKLNYDQINDIPIHNRTELLDFLRKVKALNAKNADGQAVIPAHPNIGSSAGSLMWSSFTMAGLWWNDMAQTPIKDDKLEHFQHIPTWKEYIKDWNTMYSEGLIDKENFIQKDDQAKSKAVTGQYAMFNWWEDVRGARDYAKSHGGYGYRYLPFFMDIGLDSEYQNITTKYKPISLFNTFGAVTLSKDVAEKDVPQLLNWLDWNMSEEAQVLRNWGPAAFTTGEGADRRFKPEYKDLENWSLSGTSESGQKDGPYYGLVNPGNRDYYNAETFQIGGLPYTDQPKYVYPVDVSDPAKISLDTVVQNVLKEHFGSQIKYIPQSGWSWKDVDPNDELGTYLKVNSVDRENAMIKAIVGKPAQFEANYESFLKLFGNGSDYQEKIKPMQERWKAIYEKFVKPEIEKVK